MRAVLVGLGLCLIALPVTAASISCVGEDPATASTPDGGNVPPSDVKCTNDAECPALPTTPAGCATAKCDVPTSRCIYVANDADQDGHRTHACVSQDPKITVETGGDCDDADPQLFPGRSRECAALANGTAIAFPGGTPKGVCKAGSQECNTDGTLGACTGAVAPRAEDCATSDVDEDCDGSPMNGCPCSPMDATQACNAHPGKDGVGTCKAGTQKCEASGWSTCSGAVDPVNDDCAPDGADANCDGIKGNGNGCTQTVYLYAAGGAYSCAAGPSGWPTDLYMTDAGDPAGLPNGLTLIAPMKLFAAASGTRTGVYRCYDATTGYHSVGMSGCTGATQQRLVGYASTVDGGNGWVRLAEIFGRNYGPTGMLPTNSTACGTCCDPTSFYTLQ